MNVDLGGASYQYARTFCWPAESTWTARRRCFCRMICASGYRPVISCTSSAMPWSNCPSRRQQAGVQGGVCERAATGPASEFEQGWHGQYGWHVEPVPTGSSSSLRPHETIFWVSRTAMHKSVPNGASHLNRSAEDEVRRAPGPPSAAQDGGQTSSNEWRFLLCWVTFREAGRHETTRASAFLKK